MSRDALGDARLHAGPPPPQPVQVDVLDDEPGSPPPGPPPPGPPRPGGPRPTGRPRARTLVVVAVVALAVGGLVGHRAGSATAPSADAEAQVPRPSGYAVSLPDADDPQAARVVVSWTGARELAPDRALVVAVVVDDLTRVGGVRLGDPGGGPDGSADDARPAGDEVAAAVLREAGEDPAAATGAVVTAVTGRTDGVLVVDLRDDGPDLGIVTAPRVHLAVVEGREVLALVALPVASRRVPT
ncbi:hypothetical protein WDZ17_08700 [Pseudokineococcus basanitobsidens]|uniref:Uncharacterized protein n=1 Tax=Pseudokineococcus basanitobsidens TaxID=1926649 RepID=A0ABU8RJT4_9ACTN